MSNSELQRLLTGAETKYGKDSFSARMLRQQIGAEERGQSAKELYLTGSVARLKASTSSPAAPPDKGDQRG